MFERLSSLGWQPRNQNKIAKIKNNNSADSHAPLLTLGEADIIVTASSFAVTLPLDHLPFHLSSGPFDSAFHASDAPIELTLNAWLESDDRSAAISLR